MDYQNAGCVRNWTKIFHKLLGIKWKWNLFKQPFRTIYHYLSSMTVNQRSHPGDLTICQRFVFNGWNHFGHYAVWQRLARCIDRNCEICFNIADRSFFFFCYRIAHHPVGSVYYPIRKSGSYNKANIATYVTSPFAGIV